MSNNGGECATRCSTVTLGLLHIHEACQWLRVCGDNNESVSVVSDVYPPTVPDITADFRFCHQIPGPPEKMTLSRIVGCSTNGCVAWHGMGKPEQLDVTINGRCCSVTPPSTQLDGRPSERNTVTCFVVTDSAGPRFSMNLPNLGPQRFY